jgi:hypothetical protein
MEKSTSLVKTAVAYAKSHGYSIIELSEYLDHSDLADGVDFQVIYDIGVEEWLGYLLDADYIFTNSFHACCFSIIFQKQFFVGARAGDKIDSVLELFHLSWRRVKGFKPELAESLEDIDFTEAEQIRKELTKASSDFILNAIRTLEQQEHKNRKNLVHPDVYTAEEPKPDSKPILLLKKIYRKCKKILNGISKKE